MDPPRPAVYFPVRAPRPSGIGPLWYWPRPCISSDGQFILCKGYDYEDVVALDLSPDALRRAQEDHANKLPSFVNRMLETVRTTAVGKWLVGEGRPVARELFHLPRVAGMSFLNFHVGEDTDLIAILSRDMREDREQGLSMVVDVFDGKRLREEARSSSSASSAMPVKTFRTKHSADPDPDAGAHVAVSRDGTRVAVTSGHEITVFSLRDNATWRVDLLHEDTPSKEKNEAEGAPEGKKKRARLEGDVKMQHEDDDDDEDMRKMRLAIWSIGLSWDGRMAVVGGDDDLGRIVDVERGALVARIETALTRVHGWLWTGPWSLDRPPCVVAYHEIGNTKWFAPRPSSSSSSSSEWTRLGSFYDEGVAMAPIGWGSAGTTQRRMVGAIGEALSRDGAWFVLRDAETGEHQGDNVPQPFQPPHIPYDSIRWYQTLVTWRATENSSDDSREYVTRVVACGEYGWINVWE